MGLHRPTDFKHCVLNSCVYNLWAHHNLPFSQPVLSYWTFQLLLIVDLKKKWKHSNVCAGGLVKGYQCCSF